MSDHGTFKYKGIPLLASIGSVFGDTYFVDAENGSASNRGKTPDKAYALLSTAYAAATTNNQDAIFIDGNTAVTEIDMITWAKGRTHVYGVNGAGHLGTGHGARIVFANVATAAATSLAPMLVTGWRNTFSNMKFENDSTTTESIYGHIDAGAYTTYERCSFILLNDLDSNSGADVVAQGNGTSWIECEFGAATIKSTGTRHVMLVDKIVSGNGHMDNNFKDCNFIAYTSNADLHFIHCTGTSDAQRFSMFRGCAFINWDIHAAGTTMTDAIHVPANTAWYLVLDSNTVVVGCTNIAQSTDNAGIYISAPVSTAATSGIAVNAA